MYSEQILMSSNFVEKSGILPILFNVVIIKSKFLPIKSTGISVQKNMFT